MKRESSPIEVSPGTYEVLGNINGMHIVSLKATGGQLEGRMLTVKSGDAPKLEIAAGTGHGEVEGIALLAGKPASGVMVLLAPEDPKNNEILFRRDQSDSDGTFDLEKSFPGATGCWPLRTAGSWNGRIPRSCRHSSPEVCPWK